MLYIHVRPLKTMHDEQYKSDPPALVVVPFELRYCVVCDAAEMIA